VAGVLSRRPSALLLGLLALVLALAGTGCGPGGSTRPNAEATLLLDFQPNAVHAGIYVATARGFDEAEGVELTVQAPGDGASGVKLLEANRVQFAILDIHDLALARQEGADLVGVMAIVQRPLAAILARPGIEDPAGLEGERVGVTGLPSDDAVVDSIVRGAGGDPAKVRKTQIGFDAVRSLVTGRVRGATAFWNAEGVRARRELPGVREFRVDEFGAPRYPELVLVTRTATAQDRPEEVQAVVTALRRGYRETVLGPEEAVSRLVDAVDGLERVQVQRELDAVSPAFTAGSGAIGTLDLPQLRRWAAWEAEFGITREPPDVALAFAPRFAVQGVIADGG
jgi:ABC-type nitrate/sulfonate/bicarbonate transport system substrate-binding protein